MRQEDLMFHVAAYINACIQARRGFDHDQLLDHLTEEVEAAGGKLSENHEMIEECLRLGRLFWRIRSISERTHITDRMVEGGAIPWAISCQNCDGVAFIVDLKQITEAKEWPASLPRDGHGIQPFAFCPVTGEGRMMVMAAQCRCCAAPLRFGVGVFSLPDDAEAFDVIDTFQMDD